MVYKYSKAVITKFILINWGVLFSFTFFCLLFSLSDDNDGFQIHSMGSVCFVILPSYGSEDKEQSWE